MRIERSARHRVPAPNVIRRATSTRVVLEATARPATTPMAGISGASITIDRRASLCAGSTMASPAGDATRLRPIAEFRFRADAKPATLWRTLTMARSGRVAAIAISTGAGAICVSSAEKNARWSVKS